MTPDRGTNMSGAASQKETWSDEDLFRAASHHDQDAFRVLCRRLSYLRRLVKFWCDQYEISDHINVHISELTIRSAVRWVQVNDRLPRQQKRRDWLQKLARIELKHWIRENRPDLADRPVQRRPKLTPEQSKARKAEEALARKYFDWLVNPPELREMLEQVLIMGRTPEEAGREMLGIEPSMSIVLYHDALRKLKDLMDAAEVHGADYST